MADRDPDALDDLEQLGKTMVSLGQTASAGIVRRAAEEIRRLRRERPKVEARDVAQGLFGD